MKLDFEPNLSSNYSAEAAVDAGFSADSNGVSEMLAIGVKAAQDGRRGEARVLLLQVTQIEPENENAWLWLASISEYPEELLGFLNNVLSLNPENERALEWAQATRSVLAKTFVRRGIDAARDNQNNFARQCFLQAIAHEKENEAAWLWLASVSESVEEKNAYLEKVLLLNPQNETALSSLRTVKKQMNESRLPKAVAEAIAGETEAAVETLDAILGESPEMEDALILKSFLVASFDEKIRCFEKVLEFNPESDLANASADFLRSMKAKLVVEEESLREVEPESAEFLTETSEFENGEFSLEPAVAEFSTKDAEAMRENEENPALETNDNFAVEAADDFEEQAETAEDFQLAAQPETAETKEQAVYKNFAAESESDEAAMEFTAACGDEVSEIDGGEDEEVFTVPEFENATGDAEVDDEIAKIYAEYADAEATDASGDADDGEVSLIEEENSNLPSYYENEAEDFSAKQQAVESDYAPAEQKSEAEDFPAENYETAAEFAGQKDFEARENLEAEMPEPAPELDLRADEQEADAFSRQPSEMFVCPFCKAENEPQAFVCESCRAVLSLSDLEMLLAYKDGDNETVRGAVDAMEAEKESFELGAGELKFLGIGQINLKNLRQGFSYLQEAARLNPNDVVLGSQINALAIRLAEIEQKESIHNSMPKNKTILVVDDSATVRKLISGKLEKCGHTVLNAVDGMDALEKINEAVPDLILLDINMPRMDGYQVCKLIRGNDITKDVPVVMISGKDGFFDKVRGRMAGTTGYITKPFGPETLMKTVETYIVCNSHAGITAGDAANFDE